MTDTASQHGLVSLAMRDDGQGGDVSGQRRDLLGDAGWQLAKHRRLMRYRITATDGQAQSLRVPYADDPQPNFAYFVYDGVPAWRGASQPGTTPVQDFGADVLNRLPIHHLIAQIDVTNSQYVGTYESAHFYGTLVEGGRVYDHIEFENRGEFSTYQSARTSGASTSSAGMSSLAAMTLEARTAALRTMNLSACATPWVPTNRGMACLDRALRFGCMSWLLAVPAPHMNYLQLRVIDEAEEQNATDQYRGDLWGLYGTIEQTDGAFLTSATCRMAMSTRSKRAGRQAQPRPAAADHQR